MWLVRQTVEPGRERDSRPHAQILALSRLADALDENAGRPLAFSREAVPPIARMRRRKRAKRTRKLVDALERFAEPLQPEVVHRLTLDEHATHH
jgi:hypothetical protein